MRKSVRRAPRFMSLVYFGCGLQAAAAAETTAPTVLPSSQSSTPSPSRTPAGESSALVVNDLDAQTAMGLPVETTKGEGLGHVVDLIVDRNGALLAAIVDFGGFLGVGSRKIAVDWRVLHFSGQGPLNKLITELPLDPLRSAPAYKPGEAIVIMGAPPTPTPTPSVSVAPTPTPSASP
jgi:hypothetical protein